MLPILRIYTLYLDKPLDENVRQRLFPLLNEERKEAISGKRNIMAADESLIGEVLAKYAVSKETRLPLKDINIKHTDKGMPYIEGFPLFLSITHSHGLIAVAVSSSAVGIDAEKIRDFSEGVARRMFTDRELDYIYNSADKNKRFFHIWTLKESYVKAIGTGISFPMKNLEFIIEDNKISFNLDNHSEFEIIESIDGYILSVCRKLNERD